MNNEEKIISIIIPVYKVEPYLKKCIESVIKQTYPYLQIILVDDGSPDNCGKICDEYASKDNRIEVIHTKNGGLSSARNIGISKAKGKYIGFVDSDDYISNDMYEYMYNLIEKNKADVCICNFYNIINDKNIIKNEDNGIEELNKMQILKEILLDKKIQSYAWNELYKRELFNEISYPIGKKYEDIGTTFYILEKCNKIIVSGKPKYYYLNRPDSIVNNNTEQTILDYTDLIMERYDYIDKKYRELKCYNDYYLTKILITAYIDMNSLSNVSQELKQRVKDLFKKVQKIINENDEKVMSLLDNEQKNQLNNIINEYI